MGDLTELVIGGSDGLGEKMGSSGRGGGARRSCVVIMVVLGEGKGMIFVWDICVNCVLSQRG